MNPTVLILFASCAGFCLAIKCYFRYSEHDKNYPEHTIDSIVEKSTPVAINIKIKSAVEFFCDEDGDKGTSIKDFIESRFEDSDQPNIETLESSDFEEESLCATSIKEIRPKALPSVANNNLLTIINHGEFSQTVTIETCTNENKPCQFDQSFPLGYATKCKQKYQMHTIKTLSADETEIIDDKIYFPSACDCKVFSTKNLKSRF